MKQTEEIPEPVVNGRGRHEQDARPDHELREGPIAVRGAIAEPVSFVDDEQADRRFGGQADTVLAQRLVGDYLGVGVIASEERAPLVNQNRWNYEREPLAPGECHAERHIGLPQPNRIGKQGAAMAL
jgi:hypothetical protein